MTIRVEFLQGSKLFDQTDNENYTRSTFVETGSRIRLGSDLHLGISRAMIGISSYIYIRQSIRWRTVRKGSQMNSKNTFKLKWGLFVVVLFVGLLTLHFIKGDNFEEPIGGWDPVKVKI